MSPGAKRAVDGLLMVERLVTGAGLAVAVAMLSAAALVGLYQVITRFVLQAPSSWSEPLIRALLIWMAYLGLAAAIRAGSLVSVDILRRTLGAAGRRVLETAIMLATLAILAILFWFGWDLAVRGRFQNLAGLEVSISYAYAAIPIGAFVSMLSVLGRFFDPRHEELDTAV